ncbi:MAG: hypothetical protein BWY27_00919 [Bacteroidetes bacterium ADurb.Bin234]|nr:MAG: hypothetical protein BWY27_00919 [Bacteroidetes bacterium ADurb.Bin234]
MKESEYRYILETKNTTIKYFEKHFIEVKMILSNINKTEKG